MELQIKDILKAYKLLCIAKFGEVEDSEKIKIMNAAGWMMPIADKFERDLQHAAETAKPEKYDENLRRAQTYEKALNDPEEVSEMNALEYYEFTRQMKSYRQVVDQAMRKLAEQKVSHRFDVVTPESFARLITANDWTVEQALALSLIIKN